MNHCMASLVSKVWSAVAACARRLTRRLQHGGSGVCLGIGKQLVLAYGGGKDDDNAGGGGGGATAGDLEEDGGQAQVAVWRRAILMGQRCQPLDFPGAIHYDSFGRRVQSPRCGGSRKALFCRSSDAVDQLQH